MDERILLAAFYSQELLRKCLKILDFLALPQDVEGYHIVFSVFARCSKTLNKRGPPNVSGPPPPGTMKKPYCLDDSPSETMLLAGESSKKYDFFKIFLITTIFSVLGGILGYFIGAFFFDIGMQFMTFYGYENKFISLKNDLINSEGFYAWLGILFLAGFTPLSYKVFTIASGLIGFNIVVFILIILISRGLRFFIVSYLSYKFGNLFTEFMKKNGSKFFIRKET